MPRVASAASCRNVCRLQVDVAEGGSAAAKLKAALTSAEQEDCDVFFRLKGRSKHTGNVTALGQGFVSLREMMREQRDLIAKEVGLRGKAGDVGTLTISLVGYEVLRGSAPPQLKDPTSWESAEHHRDIEFAAVDDMQLGVNDLRLEEATWRDPGIGQLWVEVFIYGFHFVQFENAQLRTASHAP